MLTPGNNTTSNNGSEENVNPILANPGLRGLLEQRMAIRDGVQPTGTPPTANIPAPSAQGTPVAPAITMPAQQQSATPQQSTPAPSADETRRNQLLNNKPALENVYNKISGSSWGQNHPGLGKVAGVLGQIPATAADLALSLKGFPVIGDTLSSIGKIMPGTTEQHNAKLGEANEAVAQDASNAEKNALSGEAQARTGLTGIDTKAKQGELANQPQSFADTHEKSVADIANLNSETNMRNNPRETNPDMATYRSLTQMGMSPREALQEIEKDKALALKPVSGEHVNLTINGKPAVGTYHPDTGKTTDSSGKEIANPVPYEKPAVNVNGNHEFAENERGRGLLDKAEGAYRSSQQSANVMRQMVDSAQLGDKMTAKMLPLEGALEITTAQGTKRINRTEVDQYAGGGSAYDKLAGMLKGAATGVPFTREIMNSMAHLADIEEKGAYENYKGAFDSATKRYKLSDETPLPGPSGKSTGNAPPTSSGKLTPDNAPEGATAGNGSWKKIKGDWIKIK